MACIEVLLKVGQGTKSDSPENQSDHKAKFKDQISWAWSKKAKATKPLMELEKCKSSISVELPT